MTSTAVPSTDPSDLLRNVQDIDRFVGSTANTFTDRLGISHKTLKGIDADAASQITSMITTKGASADSQITALITAKDAAINIAADGVLAQATAKASAASASATAAAASASNAATSASSASGSSASAATNSVSAAASATAAAAAASAVGIVAIYATKAAADAAVAGVASGSYVEVVADETRDGARARYVKSGGTLVFAVEMDPPRALAQLYVDNVAALRAMAPPARKCTVQLAGYYSPGDGGGSTLLWVPASTKTDNGGTVFRPSSNPANGRWERNADPMPARWFGAKSDGSDAAPSIQAAVNAVSATGGDIDIDNGEFCLGSKIQVKCAGADLPAAGSGSEIHFTQTNPVSLVSSGMATLKAIASMDAMVEYIYDTTDADLAPFYSRVEGLGFDGNGLASACLKPNYSMHMTIRRNRFKGDVGISYTGYGVAEISGNVFKCHKGISAVDGGGDSHIRHNDFYFLADGDVAIYLAGYAGNTEIGANIFSAEYSTGSFTAVHADNSAQPAHPMHALRILSNEFYNCLGLKAVGNATGIRNVHGITLAFNHTTGRGTLVNATYCTTLNILNNFGNDYLYGPAAGVPVTLESCSHTVISGCQFGNLQHQAIIASNCLHTQIVQNHFVNFGTAGTSEKAVDLTGTTYNTQVFGNQVIQDSASYGQNFVVESGSANTTIYGDNICNANVGVPTTFLSAASRDFTSHFKNTSSSIEIAPPGAKHLFMRPGGNTTAAQFSYVSGAVNYPVFNPTAAGVGWVDVSAAGSDSTVHIRLIPQGVNGRVWIGGKASYLSTTPSAFSANRILEVKDASGTTLYLPAMASPW